jgi:hypothetical protein
MTRRPEHPECWYSPDVGHFHRDAEIDGDIGPDDKRVIAPPKRTPEDRAHLTRVRRWTLLLIAACFALLGALLGISDARFTP